MSLMLPCYEDASARTCALEAPLADQERARILIVEDQGMVRRTLQHYLQPQPQYQVQAVTNGLEAIKAVQQAIPDLVLMDIRLPEMDGFETMLQLYQHGLPREVPVIYLSVQQNIQEKIRGLQTGATDYITKPYHHEELVLRVKIHLERYLLRKELQRQNHALQAEMTMAASLQKSLLPQSWPQTEHLGFYSIYRPSSNLSGDLFDVCRQSQDQLYFLIADVSGHGVRSAMMGAMFKVLWLEGLRCAPEPALLLRYINSKLGQLLPAGEFITVFLASLDTQNLRLRYVNAGHPPPLLYAARQDSTRMLLGRGRALGLDAEQNYITTELTLQPGDMLLLYTDGVFETFNSQEEVFGKGRLLAALEYYARHSPPAAICDQILQTIMSFSSKKQPADDLTMLLVNVSG